jgi:sugar O-acyltransferase (sialic acid O-acetyltransferase NeuD family)
MKYVVFGSGGYAKEVIGHMESDRHEIVAVVSTQPFNCDSYNKKYKVIPKLEKGMFPDAQFIMAVGDVDIKKIFVEQNENRWGNFIHSSCHVSDHAKLGVGITMNPYSTVMGNAIVGNFVTLNVFTCVAHDNVVGDFVTYSPYCGTMGNCEIGDECFFGTASYCIPKIKLGKKIKVSAGSVVRHSYTEESVLIGNPAKPRKN